MTAGLNLQGKIWRFTSKYSDDDNGGAVPSGTPLYNPVFARISSKKPTQALLEQGLETPEIFEGTLSYSAFSPTGSYDVQHNDQYEVTWPPISDFYGRKFVIIGVQHQSFSDYRRFLTVTMRRLEIANSNNLQ